jgi:hypothetical protein
VAGDFGMESGSNVAIGIEGQRKERPTFVAGAIVTTTGSAVPER